MESRTQGSRPRTQKKNEAKDTRLKCSPKKKKEKVFKNFFSENNGLQKNFSGDLKKKSLQKYFSRDFGKAGNKNFFANFPQGFQRSTTKF